jgi:biotin synthase
MQKYSLLALDGLMIGNYLTTNGQNIQSDLKMIEEMGFER